MHELFLTATIPNDDISRAVRILQGYCGMKPQASLFRRLMWEGPRKRQALKGIDPSFLARQPPNKKPLWSTLHELVSKLSYVITLIYEIDSETLGQPAVGSGQGGTEGESVKEALGCDQLMGTLRWNDQPEVAGNRPVNTRAMVQIENEKSLCSTMQALNYRFTTQLVQESYRFVNGNLIFDLSRYLKVPETPGTGIQLIYNTPLPVFENLKAFDTENKWILTVSVRVLDGSDPNQMQQGFSELKTTKSEFEGCFDFHMVSRYSLDPKVAFG